MKPHKQQPEPTKIRKLVEYYYATQSLFCNFHMIEQQAKAVGEIRVQTAVTCIVMGKSCYRHVYRAVVCKCCETFILKAVLINRAQISLRCGWYHGEICLLIFEKNLFRICISSRAKRPSASYSHHFQDIQNVTSTTHLYRKNLSNPVKSLRIRDSTCRNNCLQEPCIMCL